MAGWLLHGITHRPPQALLNLISHTLEAVEEPEHDLSTLRRYAPLPVPNPQFQLHNSESCRLSSAGSGTSATSICPILSATTNRAGDLLLVSAFDQGPHQLRYRRTPRRHLFELLTRLRLQPDLYSLRPHTALPFTLRTRVYGKSIPRKIRNSRRS